MCLGQLALHIATVPGGIASITRPDVFDLAQNNFTSPMPSSMDEVHAALEHSMRVVEETLKGARLRAHGHRRDRRAVQVNFPGHERRTGFLTDAH